MRKSEIIVEYLTLSFFFNSIHLYLILVINILNVQCLCCRSQMSGLLEEDGVGFFLFLVFLNVWVFISNKNKVILTPHWLFYLLLFTYL